MLEIDSDAAVTVVDKEFYDKHFSYIALQTTKNMLKAEGETMLSVLGQIDILVEATDKYELLPTIIIIKQKLKSPILGRVCLDVLWPYWRERFFNYEWKQGVITEVLSLENATMEKHKLTELIHDRYKDVFDPNISQPIRYKYQYGQMLILF